MKTLRSGAARAVVAATMAAVVAGAVAAPREAAAQTTAVNLQKYWGLRARLRTDFVTSGTGPGDAIPAERRDATTVIYGDATIHLGWYVGMLATELALLDSTRHPGFDGGNAGARARVRVELAEALAAIDRLDRIADASFPLPCTQSPNLNGFFVRDDVPPTHHTRLAGSLTTTLSDFAAPSEAMKEMSQDQVVHLLLGLALVKHLLPKTGPDAALRAQAIATAARVVTHIATPDGWQIVNPACGNRHVARGPDARAFSKGFSASVAYITEGATSPAPDLLYGASWDLLLNVPAGVPVNVDVYHMAMTLAAVGRGFGGKTFAELVVLATREDWYAYPALHAVLYGVAGLHDWPEGAKVAAESKRLLDELPLGAEPAAAPAGGTNVHGWSSSQRFIRAKANHYNDRPGSGLRMPGLDFMLLHNLLAYAWPDPWVVGAQVPADGGASSTAAAPTTAAPEAAGSRPAAPQSTAPQTGPVADADSSSGCSCRTSPTKGELAATFLLAMGALAVRSRRRLR